jgi:hypothetical protein
VRGRTLVGCILDEVAFMRDDTSAMPDTEVYRAVLPALATTNGMLIGISTPFRKLGLLYQKHHEHFGIDDDDVLVVQGDSRTFNPMLSELDIAKAVADDPEAGLSEWQALFRTDITAFLSEADIDACVDHDRPSELPPRARVDYYVAASAIRHQVSVDEFAALLREYRCREVIGDSYAAGWVETAFKDADIRYVRSDLTKGRLYVEGLPAFTRRTLSLPDNPRLLRELRLLERRTHVGGKDSVDHGRTGSDDLANAVFGVLHYAQKRKQRMLVGTFGYGGPVTWRDAATGEEIDPKTKEPIQRTRIRIVRIPEKLAPAARGKF